MSYENKADLVRKAHYYLCHDKEREEIARAGQQRTLKDHSSQVRARQLIELFQHYSKSPRGKRP